MPKSLRGSLQHRARRNPNMLPRMEHEQVPQFVDSLVELVPEWFDEFAKSFDLVGWRLETLLHFPYRYIRVCDPKNSALMVVVSGCVERDGRRWVHVSYSRPRRLPSYDDLVLVKERFIGPDRQAISVHPRRDEHVSLHPHCLHLWHCLDGDGLPDFRHMGEI